MKYIYLLLFSLIILSNNLFAQQNIVLENKLNNLQKKYNQFQNDFKKLEDEFDRKFSQNSNSISSVNNKFNRIKRMVDDNSSIIADNLKQLSTNKSDITHLDIAVSDLESDLSDLNSQIRNLILQIKMLEIEIKSVDTKVDSINLALDKMNYHYNLMNNKIGLLPKVFICKDCHPIFSLNSGVNFYPNDKEDVELRSSFSFGLNYNMDSRTQISFLFSNPLIKTSSRALNAGNVKVIDQWDVYLYSLYASYNFFEPTKNNLGVKIGIGAFFSNRTFDNFNNLEINNRNELNIPKQYGTTTIIEFNYSEYSQKNLLEFFLSIHSYMSFTKIEIDTGIGSPKDLGNFLVSLNAGVRFNFWGKIK